MCTAATYVTDSLYFGRTLDNEISYGESVVITPRNFSFNFRKAGFMQKHYAFIGMAHIRDNYPLYYDAVNEKGLAMAGLNFVGNAYYNQECNGKDNIAPFEFIPWILGQCDTVECARKKLENMSFVNIPFSQDLPLSELHWIIADKKEAITVETTKQGLKIYENPIGVLTNNPEFDMQMLNLDNYVNLTNKTLETRFCERVSTEQYSKGLGAVGLPGDLTSMSRFVRASFTKMNSVSGKSENESVSQFFHILQSVFQTRGCCEMAEEKYNITVYASCCNADKGIYYYKTYDNHEIIGVDMKREDLDGKQLISYSLITDMKIRIQN